MNFISTRGKAPPATIRTAIELGLAPDGGLYIPSEFPVLDSTKLSQFKTTTPLHELACDMLAPFFSTDSDLSSRLPQICKQTFHFPIPLSPTPKPQDFILELYHGPTCAFKDVGARFLAECVHTWKQATVLVATSGDTGGAVAAAFFNKPLINVVILYPKDKISKRQEAQLCCWGGNVRAIAVEGSFDDCQRLVKETLLHPQGAGPFISANSINLGRILPQMVYYAHASLQKPGIRFIIPSGNLGNSLACVWARKMGFPIGEIVLAFNANRAVPDYLESGKLGTPPTIATLANAMDVGQPSNFERMRQMFPDLHQLKSQVSAESVSDNEIRAAIRTSQSEWGQVLCPHTATAAVVRSRHSYPAATATAIVATAHPAKFESIVEPLVGHSLSVPPELAQLLGRPLHQQTIQPVVAQLQKILKKH